MVALLLDNSLLSNLFANGESAGIQMLNRLKSQYSLYMTDIDVKEATTKPTEYSKDAIIDAWVNDDGFITEVSTKGSGIVYGTDNAGEEAQVWAKQNNSLLSNATIASDDMAYYGKGGAGYGNATLQTQDIAETSLKAGGLTLPDYNQLASTLANLNSTNNVTPWLTESEAFNVTPYAVESQLVANESGIVTDPKTGVTYSLSNVLQNVLTDESGGASLTGLAQYLDMDTATLQNVLANTAVTGAGGALAALGIASMIADIEQTSAAATQDIAQKDYGAAAAAVDALAARTGTAVAAADAGFVAGAALASGEEVAAAWAAGDIALDALIAAGGPAVIAAGLLASVVGAILGGNVGNALANVVNQVIANLIHALGGGSSGSGGASGFPTGDPRTPSKAIQRTSSQTQTSMTDPIVFDMSGSGIQLTPLDTSTAYFDLHGTGVAEHTGWVGPTTGILVNTTNPTSINNLFQGFTALQALAGSGNSAINSSTPGWNSLYVWQDANGNGVADAGEVKTLSALGITSISLQTTPVSETINGNTISEVATFTYANGTSHQVAEAFFDNSNLDTIYSGPFTLNPATLLLPNLRGYGNTKDLYIAMSMDPTLLTMVDTFANQTASSALSNISALTQQIENIIYEWTGVTGVNPTSRGPYVNAQQLEAIESIVGEPYVSTVNGVTSPNPQNAHLAQTFDGAWNTFYNATLVRLLVQGPLASIFQGVQYNYNTDDFVGTMNVTSVASAIAQNTPTGVFAASQYWSEMIPVADTVATAVGISATQMNTALQTAFNGLSLSFTWAEIQPGSYMFGTGDGNISIPVNDSTPGVLTLGSGITASNIILQANSQGDLTILLNTGESITFQADLSLGGGSVISQINFADGTSMQLNQPSQPLVFTYNTPASNTSLTGKTSGDALTINNFQNGDFGVTLPYTFTPFTVPGASSVDLRGISSNGKLFVGTDSNGAFSDNGGTFTTIAVPASGQPNYLNPGYFHPAGVNDSGEIVGANDNRPVLPMRRAA